MLLKYVLFRVVLDYELPNYILLNKARNLRAPYF